MLQTFGNVLMKNTIKAHELSLEGKKIINYTPLIADFLSLRGEVENAPEGQIEIKKVAHLYDGNFTNHGRVRGHDRAIFYFHENDFSNHDVQPLKLKHFNDKSGKPFGTYLTWQGLFSFKDIKHFENTASVLPWDATQESLFFLHANEVTNKGAMSIPHLLINCENDFFNYTPIELSRSGLLTVGGKLFNGTKGAILGDRLLLAVNQELTNKNLIDAGNLSLAVGYLRNLKNIHIHEKGTIAEWMGGKGILNGPEGHILSEGELDIASHFLNNRSRTKGVEAEHLAMEIEKVRNRGRIAAHSSSDIDISHSINTKIGYWDLAQEGRLNADVFVNKKEVVGDAVWLDAVDFTNLQQIIAHEHADLSIGSVFRNAADALVYSLKTLVVNGDNAVVQNDGYMVGACGLGMRVQEVINTGQMVSDDALLIQQKGGREGFQNIDGLLMSAQIVLEADQGSNTSHVNESIGVANVDNLQGIIARELLHLTTQDQFVNDGHMVGGKKALFEGTGQFINNETINKTEDIIFSLPEVVNNSIVRSYQNITFDQLSCGLTNNELILSDGTLNINQCADFVNNGIAEGRKGDVSVDSEFFNNRGMLSALDGPLNIRVNQGQNKRFILGQKNVGLTIGDHFINDHTIRSKALLAIEGNSFTNNQLLEAKDLETRLQSLENHGPINTETADIQAELIENTNTISGQKGVSIHASEIIKQTPTGRLQSEESAIFLEAPRVELEGEITGQNIEIRHTGETPFVSNNVDIKPLNALVLDVANGWDLEGRSQTLNHSLELIGKILNPAALHIKGDFTWHVPSNLTTTFDIIVEGILTLIVGGEWQNFANIQGQSGTRITTTRFTNNGTFYGAGENYFECPLGVNNHGQMELWGDCEVRTPQGSILNHPNAGFYQKNLTDHENFVRFIAEGDIDNYNSIMSLEGDFHGQSKRFLNRSPAPTVQYLPAVKIPDAGGGNFRDVRSREFAVLRQDNGRGALFHARNASVESTTLLNNGSTFTTAESFDFDGSTLINETRHFYERGNDSIQYSKTVWVKGRRSKSRALRHKKKPITVFKYHPAQPYAQPLDAFHARIYSHGTISTPNVTRNNTGEIKAHYVGIIGGSVSNIQRHDLSHILPPVPSFVPLTDMYTNSALEGPSFWKVDTEQETAFQINTIAPQHVLSEVEIEEQLYGAPQDLSEIIGDLEAKVAQLMGKEKREGHVGITAFWHPQTEDLETYSQTLTPESLLQVPPRIALINNSLVTGGARMHHHPAIVADLVVKTFMETLGYSSLSQNLTNPLLLTRVLEESGYLNAVRLHGKDSLATIEDWDTLSLQEQLAAQLRELITQVETEDFRDPALIYRVWEDFGEKVLSAVITFPQTLREAFEVVSGRILATYLSIETKEVLNDKGTLQGKEILYINTEEDFINDEGKALGGIVVSKNRKLANLSGLIEGDEVYEEADHLHTETKVERVYTGTGYEDRLKAEATHRAKKKDLRLNTKYSHTAIGGLYEANENATIIDEGNSCFESQQAETDNNYYTDNAHTSRYTLKNKKHRLKAGKNITHIIGNDVLYKGVTADAGEDIHRYAGGKSYDQQITDIFEEQITETAKKKRWYGSTKRTVKTQSSIHTGDGNEYDAGNAFNLTAKDDEYIQGIKVKSAPGKSKIESEEGQIILDVARSFHHHSREVSKKNLFWQSAKQDGFDHEDSKQSQLPDDIVFETPEGIQFKVPIRTNGDHERQETVFQALDRMEQEDGQQWIKNLRARHDVTWEEIEEAHHEWHYKTQGLTGPAAALIMLAVTLATAGAGTVIAGCVSAALTSALGATCATMVGASIAVGMQTLTAQATVSLINNQGNIGRTLHDLGSSANLRSLAISMATAGLAKGIDLQFGDFLVDTGIEAGVNSDLMQHISNKGIQGLSHTVAHSAIEGGKFFHTLGDDMKMAGVNAVASFCAEKLGEWSKGEKIDPKTGKNIKTDVKIDTVTHKILHGVVGGVTAKATGQDVTAGIAGAMIAETFAELHASGATERAQEAAEELAANENRDVKPEDFVQALKADRKFSAALGKIAAVTAALATGQDVKTAQYTAENAIDNNFLGLAILAADIGFEIWREAYPETWERVREEGLDFAVEYTGLERETLEKFFKTASTIHETISNVSGRGIIKQGTKKVGKQVIKQGKKLTKKTKKIATNDNLAKKPTKKLDEQPWTIREGQEWKGKIHGRAQVTGTRNNPDKVHAFKTKKEAIRAAKRDDVTYVQMDRGVNRMLPKENRLGPKGNRRPDVAYKTKDGKIHQVEVESRTDDARQLRQRMEDTRSKFPKEMQNGRTDVIRRPE
jgi:hypothetical protein